MSDRLFDIEEYPEVPLLPEPRGRVLAARGVALDARFLNDYPPEWDHCTTCGGGGRIASGARVVVMPGASIVHEGVEYSEGQDVVAIDLTTANALQRDGKVDIVWDDPLVCPDCLGMGSLKARVRLEAGHRCVRCKHPYIPKGDAKMLGVQPSGLHLCPHEGCSDGVLVGERLGETVVGPCPTCKGDGWVWSGWSACDEQCVHGGPMRVYDEGAHIERASHDGPSPDWQSHLFVRTGRPSDFEPGLIREAKWRILTVHHLDGDKANVRWWNLAALCQRCHLGIQAKVVMERVYPHEHSDWFKPYVAGYYAWMYLGEELTREETLVRLDELLELELVK